MQKKWIFWGGGLILVAVVVKTCSGGQGAPPPAERTYTVKALDLEQKVVESGTIDATEVVEVKSQAGGRVSRLFVDEGDMVTKGQLIALIDPRETRNRVAQDAALLRSAQAGAQRTALEIGQRRISAQAAYSRARSRADQVRIELAAQPKLTRANIQQAEASLRAAVAAREALMAATQKNELSEARNAVTEAETALAIAENDLQREAKLLEVGYTSKREQEAALDRRTQAQVRLQNARDRLRGLSAQQASALRAADERVAQAQAELTRARTNSNQDQLKAKELEQAVADLRTAEAGLRDVQVLQASLAQGQAAVDQNASSLNESRRLLGETEIRAPITGIIGSKKIKVGETVSALNSFSSGTAIFTIEDRNAMIVKIQINEIDVAKLKLGMPATVEIDALPKEKFTGKVSKIAAASVTSTTEQLQQNSQGNRAVVKYQVEIRLEDHPMELKSGMTARCTMVTQSRKGILAIPAEYLGKDGEKRFVLIGKTTKTAKRTPVTVGLETGAKVEVLTGLRDGDVLAKPTFTGPKRQGENFGPN